MNNQAAKGYLKKALNLMIENNSIDTETAENIIYNMSFEMDLMTENQAEKYYNENHILQK